MHLTTIFKKQLSKRVLVLGKGGREDVTQHIGNHQTVITIILMIWGM